MSSIVGLCYFRNHERVHSGGRSDYITVLSEPRRQWKAYLNPTQPFSLLSGSPVSSSPSPSARTHDENDQQQEPFEVMRTTLQNCIMQGTFARPGISSLQIFSPTMSGQDLRAKKQHLMVLKPRNCLPPRNKRRYQSLTC